MSTFDPALHPRGRPENSGAFTQRQHSTPENELELAPTGWPAIGAETLRWESRYGGDYGVPSSQTYQAAVVPEIADLTPQLPASMQPLLREAEHALIRFDQDLRGELEQYGPLLLRSEAVASSQIENLSASARAILTAELGVTTARNASEIVNATHAMEAALRLSEELTVHSVLEMHAALMADTRHTPGALRTEAVWIGSSARSPVGATFVAPRFENVPALMDDVMKFANRGDLSPLIQASVAHAQFETIHPFTDGNGRTGRALVQSTLRNKRLTQSVTIPVSAGLLSDIPAYHQALGAYRSGDITPIVEQFSYASLDAVNNATRLVSGLRHINTQWNEITKARPGSQLAHTIGQVVRMPVFTASTLATALNLPATNTYRLIERLAAHELVKGKNEYRVGQVWRADQVLAELDQFAERAARRT